MGYLFIFCTEIRGDDYGREEFSFGDVSPLRAVKREGGADVSGRRGGKRRAEIAADVNALKTASGGRRGGKRIAPIPG